MPREKMPQNASDPKAESNQLNETFQEHEREFATITTEFDNVVASMAGGILRAASYAPFHRPADAQVPSRI